MKTAGPAFAIPVSKEEKKRAEALRQDYELLLKNLEKFSRYLLVLFDHLDDLQGDQSLESLRPLFKKYEQKLIDRFKIYMDQLGKTVQHYNGKFTDTELDNVRDLVIENTKNMRKGLVSLLKLFNKVEDPQFVTESQAIYAGINSNIEQIEFIISEELFTHIDFNILGRIRLGIAQIPLTIREGNDGI